MGVSELEVRGEILVPGEESCVYVRDNDALARDTRPRAIDPAAEDVPLKFQAGRGVRRQLIAAADERIGRNRGGYILDRPLSRSRQNFQRASHNLAES